MADRNNSGLGAPAVIITLLAALGIGGTLRRSTAPANPPTLAGATISSAPAKPAAANVHYEKNGGYEHSAAFLLEKFFSKIDDGVEDKKPWATYQDPVFDPAHPAGTDFSSDSPHDPRADYSVRFLIATLPLPTSPPLRYFFDSELDALESAAGTAGYSLDSYDFPWNEPKDTSGKFQLGSEIDITSPPERPGYSFALNSITDANNRWKHDGGVILFRHDQKLLVVFVIGETPTWGINRTAFRDALDQIAWLKGWLAADAEHKEPPAHLVDRFKAESIPSPLNEIRIVGPTFSGSVPSLRNAIEEWRRSLATRLQVPVVPSIRIVSGTATSVKDGELSDPGDVRARLPAISFNTVQVPDSVLWKQLPTMLKSIADIVPTPQPETSGTPGASPLGPTATPTPTWMAILGENTVFGKASNNEKNDGILHLTFPLHISDLRSAQQGTQNQGATGPNLGRHDLDLPDEAAQQRMDVIPTYSPRGAIYDQLILSDLLTAIRRENIHYVGIVAADVEDLIFLVQQIRIYCPDTIVFTTSGDIRFLHSQVNTDLRGLLVFSTYPLFDQGQQWTWPFGGESELRTFSSDSAHGVYNATIIQLDEPGQAVDYGEPFVEQPQYPVIQVGVVGRDEIWPLAFQIPSLGNKTPVWRSHLENQPETPTTLRLDGSLYPPAFELLIAVMNIGFLACVPFLFLGELYARRDWFAALIGKKRVLLFLSKRQPPSGVHEQWWLTALLINTRSDPRFIKQRALCLMFFAIGMLLAEIIGLGFALIPVVLIQRGDLVTRSALLSFAHFLWSGMYAVGLARGRAFSFEIYTTFLVLLATIISILRMLRVFGFTSLVAWLWALAAASPIVLALCFVGHQWTRTPLAFALYAFVRATHLYSGVSPLMALVFLGLAGFTLIAGAFWRVAMLEDRPLPPPLAPADKEPPSFRGVAILWGRAVYFLENSIIGGRAAAFYMLPLLVTAFVYFCITKVYAAYSMDGWRFDILFLLLAFGVYSMFSFALLRFALTWIALRHLLHRLYFHPSRYSYKNLQLAAQPTHLDRQKIRLYEARPGLTAIEYGLGCVRAILRIVQGKANPTWADPTPTGLVKEILDHRTELQDELDKAERHLEAVLAEINWATTVVARKALYQSMTELSKIILPLFEPSWRMSAVDAPREVNLGSPTDEKPTTDRKLLDQAELFVASRVGDFVRNVFPHLINLIGSAMPAVLAMVLAVSAYPFPAHDTLLWVSWTVLLATVAISLYVFVSINRNPIVSMFSGTDPGEFNWDNAFSLHLVLFAVIPILTLLGAQFPQALSGTVSWFGSVLGGGGNG